MKAQISNVVLIVSILFGSSCQFNYSNHSDSGSSTSFSVNGSSSSSCNTKVHNSNFSYEINASSELNQPNNPDELVYLELNIKLKVDGYRGKIRLTEKDIQPFYDLYDAKKFKLYRIDYLPDEDSQSMTLVIEFSVNDRDQSQVHIPFRLVDNKWEPVSS